VAASNLLQKVYFPRLLLPIAAAGSYLLDFLIALAVLFALMLYFGVALSPTVLWIVPLTVIALTVAIGTGILLSAINVRYRDVRHAIPFLVQAWLFASPVAYAASLVPTEWRSLFQVNPMTGVIDGFRWAVLPRGNPPVGEVVISAVVAIVVLVFGLLYFRRVERTFADVI
jgi:lipopolysaccharide transport system permease protein